MKSSLIRGFHSAAASVVISAGMIATASADVNVGLIGSWKFAEGFGTVANDSSGNGFNGVFGGITPPQWTTGQNGPALRFDGQTSSVSVAHNAVLNPDQISIAFWINTSSYVPNNNGSIIQKGGSAGYRVRCSSSNVPCRPQFIFGYLIGASGPSLPLNEWHHVVATADSSGTRIFVDGVLSGTNSQPYFNSNPSGSLVVGGSNDPSMALYDVRIYNRALAPGDVSALYQLGVIPPSPDRTAPSVSLSAPAAGSTVSGAVSLSANASDPVVAGETTSGVAGVRFLVDGIAVGEDLSSPYSISWKSNLATDGPHQLTAVATDNAGNSAASSPVGITVDNTTDRAAPVLSNGLPAGILPPETIEATLSLSTDEDASCKYGTVPNTAYASLPSAFTVTGATGHSARVNGLTAGSSYTYYVRCVDRSGNANTADYAIAFAVASPSGGIDNGLILHLTFDNATYSDSSPLRNRVTWAVPGYVPGVHSDRNPADTAASTTGAYLSVNANPAYSGMNALTYSMWVKKNVPTAYEWMLEESGPYYLLVTDQGYVKAGVFSVDSTQTTQYYRDIISYYQGNNTAWNLYSVVYDGSQYRLYINGTKVAAKSCTLSNCLGAVLYWPTNPIIIAGRRPNQYFNGAIDDVRIYNRALSDSEIGQLYSGSDRSAAAQP